MQSVDLVAQGRIRPWVAGGITYVRALDQQQLTFVSQSTPSTRSVDTTQIDRSAGAAVAAVGVRIYVTRRLFISGDGSFRGYLGDTPLGAFNALWRGGIGFGF